MGIAAIYDGYFFLKDQEFHGIEDLINRVNDGLSFD
jgi:hypothetical protein